MLVMPSDLLRPHYDWYAGSRFSRNAVTPSWPSGETRSVGNPVHIVDALHNALIEVATDGDSLNFESRFRKLEPAIDDSHDFSIIARLVGGHFWKNLSENERSLFTEAFRRASIATYASRFASASGVSFDRAKVDHRIGDRVSVLSHLTRADGSRVVFVYALQDKRDQWRIISIVVDGVSDLALQRAELTTLYYDSGLQGVMGHLEAKVEGSKL